VTSKEAKGALSVHLGLASATSRAESRNVAFGLNERRQPTRQDSYQQSFPWSLYRRKAKSQNIGTHGRGRT
jgi:hypothetical protein